MIYLLLGFVGTALFIFGFLKLCKITLKKEVLKVVIGVSPVTVDIPKIGTYGILIEKKKVEDITSLKLLNADVSKIISFNENSFKFSFYKLKKIWIEYYLFEVSHPEQLLLQVDFNKIIENNKPACEILLIESFTNKSKILSIVACVSGLNLSFWGFALYFNPLSEFLR